MCSNNFDTVTYPSLIFFPQKTFKQLPIIQIYFETSCRAVLVSDRGGDILSVAGIFYLGFGCHQHNILLLISETIKMRYGHMHYFCTHTLPILDYSIVLGVRRVLNFYSGQMGDSGTCSLVPELQLNIETNFRCTCNPFSFLPLPYPVHSSAFICCQEVILPNQKPP